MTNDLYFCGNWDPLGEGPEPGKDRSVKRTIGEPAISGGLFRFIKPSPFIRGMEERSKHTTLGFFGGHPSEMPQTRTSFRRADLHRTSGGFDSVERTMTSVGRKVWALRCSLFLGGLSWSIGLSYYPGPVDDDG